MKWLAAAAGLGVIIFSFGYAIYYIIRGGGCAGCGMTGICHSEGPQNPLLSAYRHDHPSGQSPQYPGSFSGGDSASEHGCEIGKR